MKILLIQPPINPNIIGVGIAYLTEPLALEIISASVPEHNVNIFDMRMEESTIEQKLDNFKPDIVGITGYTTEVYKIIDISQKVKKYDRNILTVVGGHHATMLPNDFDKESIDVVVIGEGENTFRELVNAYEKGLDFSNIDGIGIRKNGNLVFTKSRQLNINLDKVPLPNRSLTKKYRNRYFRGKWRPLTSMMTSKGCPFRCIFCALWKITRGKYLVRRPESVVDELSNIEEKYIDFAEDNFLHNIKRAEGIYELIKERNIKKIYKLYARSDTIVRHPDIIEKWKEIGMELILVGLESFRDDELKKLNKSNTIKNNEEAIHILQKNNVEIAAYFIINPNYTEEDFEALAEYVQRMNLTQPIFTVLTPLPGTKLYEQRFNELTTHNYELFDFVHCVLPTKLPREKFYQCLLELYRKCYTSSADREKISSISDEIFNQIYLSLSNTHKVYLNM